MRIRIWVFFFLGADKDWSKLRWKRQSYLNAHTAARQQPRLHLFACFRVSIFVTMSAKLRWFVLRDHFRSERNVRGHSGYTRRATSSSGTYLAFLWFNTHTSPGSELLQHREELGQLQGVLLVWVLSKAALRWARKMRSVSPRMRNMRGMGAGMKWTRWTELNGAGWEGLASPWIEWEMGGWVEKKRERGKGPDCMGCVQQQKERSGA